MAYSYLRGWTPIAYKALLEPAIVWADLGDHRFEKRPFNRILDAWRGRPASPVIHTGLDALTALDGQPSLDPDLIIAHPSRCGSSLLAGLAAVADGTMLLAEPPVLTSLLLHNLRGGIERPVGEVLREVIRAFGRIRFKDERRYVLKLNSRTTRFLPEIRKAFPNVPVIWLQRQPAEIVESNISCPPGRPPGAGVDWTLRRVTLAFMAAKAFVDDRVHVLDYREVPDAAWERLANIMGFDPIANAGRMRELIRLDPKTGEPFRPRARQPLSDEVQAIIHDTLEPIYEALAMQRSC